MPTVLIVEGFIFFLYSSEGNEPPHIHVERAGAKAKLWLVPEVRVAYVIGMKKRDLRRMTELVHEHKDNFIEAWKAHFR